MRNADTAQHWHYETGSSMDIPSLASQDQHQSFPGWPTTDGSYHENTNEYVQHRGV